MRNWREEGYYTSGIVGANSIYSWWQTGWVSGMILTLPLLAEGTELSRRRALRNIGFFFDTLQSPAGFFYGIFAGGRAYGGSFSPYGG